MEQLITLHNVIDIRTGKFHPIAIIYQKNEKYYKPVEESNEENNEI